MLLSPGCTLQAEALILSLCCNSKMPIFDHSNILYIACCFLMASGDMYESSLDDVGLAVTDTLPACATGAGMVLML